MNDKLLQFDSLGRDLSSVGKPVRDKIMKGSVEEFVVQPSVSGMPRPMTILLATRKGELVKWSYHGNGETFCPPIWADLAIGSGACGFGCRSCFLMLTFRTRRDPFRPYVYVNGSAFERETLKWLQAKSWEVNFGKKGKSNRPRTVKDSIGLGIDCADSLLFEGVTGHARTLIPLFTDPGTNPLRNPIVLLTKSANTHYLAQITDTDLRRVNGKVPNVVVSMSLNPEAIADLWEGKYPGTLERMTPPIEARLVALRRAQDLGFEVRARIDPILTPAGWEEHYRSFFSEMAHKHGLRPSELTLGTYREKNAQLDTFREKWGLPAPEWAPRKTEGREGTHVHDADRLVTYTKVRDIIAKSFGGTGFMPHVSLCKETFEVRKAAGLCSANCNCLRAPETWKPSLALGENLAHLRTPSPPDEKPDPAQPNRGTT